MSDKRKPVFVIILLGLIIFSGFNVSYGTTTRNNNNTLIIQSPQESQVYLTPMLPIQGQGPAETKISLYLNDSIVDNWVIGPSELFIKQIKLQEGENSLRFVAKKNDGSLETYMMTVNFNKNVPERNEIEISSQGQNQLNRQDSEDGLIRRLLKGLLNIFGRN